MGKWLPLLSIMALSLSVSAGQGRYLTWLDDQGRIHNTFIETRSGQVHRGVAPRRDGEGWSATLGGSETKRRYFTWVDASGALQSSFHVAEEKQGAPSGKAPDPLDDEYVDSEWLEERNFQRPGREQAYFTWVDDRGRVRNSPLGQGAVLARPAAEPLRFSEGRQIEFALPALDGQSLADDRAPGRESGAVAEQYRELLGRCCEQLSDSDFIELSMGESRYEELNDFSPRLKMAHFDSRYVGVRLPPAGQRYGLRVRSFANRELVYPTLLFLDEARRPTRLVSEAISTLHPESWHRYAFLEGTVPVFGGRGERYVLILTTEEDRARITLDNRPFKRPLKALEVNETGLQVHRHGEQGSFELTLLR